MMGGLGSTVNFAVDHLERYLLMICGVTFSEIAIPTMNEDVLHAIKLVMLLISIIVVVQLT